MDRFEHRIALTDVRASRGAYAALKFGSLIGDDIAVEIAETDSLPAAAW